MPSFGGFIPACCSLFSKAEPAALRQHVPLECWGVGIHLMVFRHAHAPQLKGPPGLSQRLLQAFLVGLLVFFFKWYSSSSLCKRRICLEKWIILPADHLQIYSMLNLGSLRQPVWWVLTNHIASANQFLIHDRIFCSQSAVVIIWQQFLARDIVRSFLEVKVNYTYLYS